MNELKEALKNELKHVDAVYFVGKDWFIKKPNVKHEVKTRAEILGEKEPKKKEKETETEN